MPPPLPPLPIPLPPWARALLYLAETVTTGILWNHYDYAAQIFGGQKVAADPLATEWRRFVIKAENTASTDTADDQFFSFELVNITNGTVDSTWTDADYQTVATHVGSFLDAVKVLHPGWLSYTEVAAYIRAFNPYTESKPFVDAGTPDFVWVIAKPGLATGSSAPQISTAITEMTPVRRHWGRMYLPTVQSPTANNNGRFSQANVDLVANAASTMYLALSQAEFFPVVATTMVDKAPMRVLSVVNNVRVDDVPDVIRRRRYRNSLYTHTAPALPLQ